MPCNSGNVPLFVFFKKKRGGFLDLAGSGDSSWRQDPGCHDELLSSGKNKRGGGETICPASGTSMKVE